jgi:hypothetical protein
MRAAVLDNRNYVVNVIMADAATDTLSGVTLVDVTDLPHVSIGYMLSNGEFVLTPESQAAEDAMLAELEQQAWLEE